MSFLLSESAFKVTDSLDASGSNQARSAQEATKLGRKAFEFAAVEGIRARRREAAQERRVQTQINAQRSRERDQAIRFSNLFLSGQPRVGGSVLGGRGR